jgi:release factor glutamine methyltransferase
MTLPPLSAAFKQAIEECAANGTYRVETKWLQIDVFPYVFPPSSPFSESTVTASAEIGDVRNKRVLDIGTGTGVLALLAALHGAAHVDAVDVLQEAVVCAKHNVALNNLSHTVHVWESNLFDNISVSPYDVIIANLPILDCEETDVRFHSLSDPAFAYHEALFQQAPKYLAANGRMMLCHANIQKDAFERLEALASRFGWKWSINEVTHALDCEWRAYEFRR